MTIPARFLELPLRAASRPSRLRGVTLVELIFTIGIIAILSTVAIPEFGAMRRSASRRAAVNDFLHALFLARSQAVMINGVVSICRSRDGTTCENQNGNWNDGWIVFKNTDRDQPAERDTDEEIIYKHEGWNDGDITSNRVSFSFRPTAQADVNGTVVFCGLGAAPSDARAIIISQIGRPRVSTRDASNRALQCP
jgi:type IV fimbrial biogenesis protein FimT